MAESAPLTTCPPWLLEHWRDVFHRHEKASLPHALLFTGMPGLGKKQFARFVAESLLCTQSSADTGACGECESCAQLIAGSNPELMALNPEGAAMSIKVDSVRELVGWLQLSAPQGRYRVALIDSSDAMNRHAANSLLKTLEEPGERAVLLLAASRPGALPATVRSRCQTTLLTVRDHKSAVDWLVEQGLDDVDTQLTHAQVGPLGIVEHNSPEWLVSEQLLKQAWRDLFLMRASVGKIVDTLSDLSIARCLNNFSNWALLANKKLFNVPIGVDPATAELISDVHGGLDSEQWFTLHDRIHRLYRSDSASFKTQTVLEGLFADIRLMTQD